jgi:RecA-family ATPase
VIILNAEDGADDTVVPRLIAAGADLSRVHIVSSVLQGDGKGHRSFNLQADLALLEQKIAEIGDVALVIIDPISSYMGKIDSHKNTEVRGALEPASEMAERLKVAILSITHFSKSGGNTGKALHRFIGSIAFVGAPRAAFAVIEDVDHEDRILFLHAKNNMAPKAQGLAYRLFQTIVGDGEGIVASYVVWDGNPVTMSANEALRATDGGGDRTAAAEAEEFLRETLSSGPKPATDIKADSNEAGLSWATIRRAKDRLSVIAERESQGRDGRGRWLWTLPSAARCSSNLQDAHVSDVSTLHQNEHLAEKAPIQPRPKPAPASDPWQDLEIPPSLLRVPPAAPVTQTNGRAPALGPPGDSLDDFK